MWFQLALFWSTTLRSNLLGLGPVRRNGYHAEAGRHRKGRAFSAYLHLSHATGEKGVKTIASPDGLLIVDYGRQVAQLELRSPPHRPFLSTAE